MHFPVHDLSLLLQIFLKQHLLLFAEFFLASNVFLRAGPADVVGARGPRLASRASKVLSLAHRLFEFHFVLAAKRPQAL